MADSLIDVLSHHFYSLLILTSGLPFMVFKLFARRHTSPNIVLTEQIWPLYRHIEIELKIKLTHMHVAPLVCCRRGYRISWRGGGEDIQKPPPWTLSAWRHPPSEKLKNTPTLGHSQAHPPPLGQWRHPHWSRSRLVPVTIGPGHDWSRSRLVPVTIGPGHDWSRSRLVPVTHTLHRFSVSGQVQGGGGDHSCHPPSWIRHCAVIQSLNKHSAISPELWLQVCYHPIWLPGGHLGPYQRFYVPYIILIWDPDLVYNIRR